MRSVNFFLCCAVAACAWLLWSNAQAARARRSFVSPAVVALPLGYEAPVTPAAVAPVEYADIALRSMFSRDRNPHVMVEPVVEAKPVPTPPSFPRAFGVMDLGEGPVVLLEWDGRQRAYTAGNAVGPWQLASITAERLTFEWNGQRFEKALGELLVRAEGIAVTEPERRDQHPLVSPGSPNPWLCQPGDNSSAGTVQDGRRKVESNTPFGKVCRWEPV